MVVYRPNENASRIPQYSTTRGAEADEQILIMGVANRQNNLVIASTKFTLKDIEGKRKQFKKPLLDLAGKSSDTSKLLKVKRTNWQIKNKKKCGKIATSKQEDYEVCRNKRKFVKL